MRRAMLSAQASVFVASAPRAESSMRDQLQHVVGASRVRHASLPGITPATFAAGLAACQEEIAASGTALPRSRSTVSRSPSGDAFSSPDPARSAG